MKKRFYTVGSLICAGLLAVFGFGSCKSGKALQAERTRLSAQADSLTRRMGGIDYEIDFTLKRIQQLNAESHLAMYGGPNMTEEERQRMEKIVRQKEEEVRERIKAEDKKLKELQQERSSTNSKLYEVMDRLAKIGK